MFGKRPGGGGNETVVAKPKPASPPSTAAGSNAPPPPPPKSGRRAEPPAPVPLTVDSRSDQYYEIKTTIFNALIDTIDLAQLAQLDAASAREEIRDIVPAYLAAHAGDEARNAVFHPSFAEIHRRAVAAFSAAHGATGRK